MDLGNIEGLVAVEPNQAIRNLAGNKFNLPPDFESDKWASKWVENGPEVQEAAQPVYLQHANATATGWSIWKGEDKKPCERTVGKRKYILLCRPLELQRAVNTIYGSQSRALANGELKGETNHANPAGDPGMLTNADLRALNRKDGVEGDDFGYLPSIPVSVKPQQAAEIPVTTN